MSAPPIAPGSSAAEVLRRAKIVATLGPSCSTEDVFRKLVDAGLDVVRLNFSHGSHEQKADLIRMVRKVAVDVGRPLCILADLQGPKIRTAKLKDHKPVTLVAGEKITISPHVTEGTKERVGTILHHAGGEPGAGCAHSALRRPDRTDRVRDSRRRGGVHHRERRRARREQGHHLPGVAVKVPSLTEKDEEDLVFALGQGVDVVAVSFVRTAADVQHVKQRIAALNPEAWVIAKLEKPQAIEHLDSILEVADGVMVARGDLGVEVPPEKVPAIQKHVIKRAAEYRKPVITATQMLESMIENPRPTRAEAL